MASAGAPARAYNRGLGAEPPYTAEVQGAEPPVGGQGAIPPEADEVFVFKILIMVALWNRADH